MPLFHTGSYGSTTSVGTFTVDAKGRLTAAGTAAIAFPVTTVFGRTGAVVAASGDYNTAQVTESTNLYFTAARAQAAISATAPLSYSGGVVSHLATDGNLHVPATSTTNSGKALVAGATAGSISWTTLTTSHVSGLTGWATKAYTNGSTTDVAEGTNLYYTDARANARVSAYASSTAPSSLGTAAVGTGTTWARADHVHAMPTLDALSNTTITSNTSGEILRWNGTAWVNATLAEAGIQAAGSYLTGNQTITLSGVVTGSGTTAITTSIADAALTIAKTSGLQAALDAKMASANFPDLIAIENLSGTSGLLKKTSANTWSLDTTTYLSTVTGDTTSRAANTIYAAPSGSAGSALFRLLVPADIPNIDTSKLTSGTLGVARGGTGKSSWVQYAVPWAISTTAIDGTSALLFDGTSLTIGDGTGSPYAIMQASSGGRATQLFRTGTSNRFLQSWDPSIDKFVFESRNDDGSSRNEWLSIPRNTTLPVVAGGAGLQQWRFSGQIQVATYNYIVGNADPAGYIAPTTGSYNITGWNRTAGERRMSFINGNDASSLSGGFEWIHRYGSTETLLGKWDPSNGMELSTTISIQKGGTWNTSLVNEYSSGWDGYISWGANSTLGAEVRLYRPSNLEALRLRLYNSSATDYADVFTISCNGGSPSSGSPNIAFGVPVSISKLTASFSTPVIFSGTSLISVPDGSTETLPTGSAIGTTLLVAGVFTGSSCLITAGTGETIRYTTSSGTSVTLNSGNTLNIFARRFFVTKVTSTAWGIVGVYA